MTNRPFSFRQCLLLCIPALVLGLFLRMALVNATPEGFYGADSNSYFSMTTKLWNHGKLACDQKRRWSYPILLSLAPIVPISPAHSIPLAQHALGLLSIVGIGWIVGNLTCLRALWVPLVTTLFAIWPRILWYEHEIVAESFFLSSFILTAALAMPSSRLKDPKGLFWFLVSAALIVSIKPHGRGLWLGCLVGAALITLNPFQWNRKCWGAIAAGIIIMLTSGSSSQGNWLLLSSTLPLVNIQGEKYKEYRKELAPLVEQTGYGLSAYPWNQKFYKKLLSSTDPADVSPGWAKLAGRQAEFSAVCKTFAHEAILSHPIEFSKLTLTKIALAFSNREANSRLDPVRFWRDQNEKADGRWKNSRDEMERLYGMDEASYNRLVAERVTRNFPFTKNLKQLADNLSPVIDRVDSKTNQPYWFITWWGWLSLMGLGFCLTPSRFAATSVLWLPSLLYVGSVFAVGDRLNRYVLPVDWVLFICVAIGLDALLTMAMRACGMGPKEAELPAPSEAVA